MVFGGDVKSVNEILEYEESPFLSGRLPEKATSVSELTSIPLTTKQDLRDHSPFGFLAVPKTAAAYTLNPLEQRGKPVSIWLTEEDLADNTA